MKIEELTVDDIDQIADGLKAQLRDLADRKHEEALIAELNASDKSDKEKLRDYFARTRLRPCLKRISTFSEGIENQYLEQQFRIHRHQLKKVRDELQEEGLVTTFTDVAGILRVCPVAWQ